MMTEFKYIDFIKNYLINNKEEIFIKSKKIDEKNFYILTIKPKPRPYYNRVPINDGEIKEVLKIIENNLYEKSFDNNNLVVLDKEGNTNSSKAFINNFFKSNPSPENFIGAFHSIFQGFTNEFLEHVNANHKEHGLQFLTSSITLSACTNKFFRVLTVLRKSGVPLKDYKDMLPTYFTHHKKFFLNDSRYQNTLFEFVVNRLNVSERENYQHLLPDKADFIKPDEDVEIFSDKEKATAYLTLSKSMVAKKFYSLVINEVRKKAIEKLAVSLENNKSLFNIAKVNVLNDEDEVLFIFKANTSEPINLNTIREVLDQTLYEYNSIVLKTKDIPQSDVDKMFYKSYMDKTVQKENVKTTKVNKI